MKRTFSFKEALQEAVEDRLYPETAAEKSSEWREAVTEAIKRGLDSLKRNQKSKKPKEG